MLEAVDVSFRYQTRSIFEGLSFKAGRGEVLYLTGSNGSGKTTLLRVLSGFLSDFKGTLKNQFKTQTALFADSNHLFLNLSAQENLRFWNADDSQHAATLNAWGLKGEYVIQSLAVSKFSTGMKRRVALARSFSSKADLLLLDEPCNGLDTNGVTIFRSALQKAIANGMCVIIVSHDPSILDGIAHRKISLDRDTP